MKRIFLMWYEDSTAQKAYRLFIDPRFCLMTKDEAKEHVSEYNKTHADNYRYYSIPRLWQRTRPNGDEESISDIDRFMRNYYLHYDNFILQYTHPENIEENKIIMKYIQDSSKKMFKKQYYDLINFIRDELNARISKIFVHQDDLSADMVTIDLEINDELHNIIMKRAGTIYE